MNRKIFIAAFLAVSVLSFFAVLPAHAAEANPTVPSSTGGINISNLLLGIPGTHDVQRDGLPALVANFYDLALLLSGLLAFGSVIYSGVLYFSHPGSTEVQTQSKDQLRDTALGLLLLIFLYLVLNVINPDLTHLRFPVLKRLDKASSTIIGAPNPNTDPIDPNKDVYACVPAYYLQPGTQIDPTDPFVSKCSNDKATVDGYCSASFWSPTTWGNAARYVSKLDSEQAARICGATNPIAGVCQIQGKTLSPIPTLTGEAKAAREAAAAGNALRTSDDPGINSNLQAVTETINRLKQHLPAGASLHVNSQYRPLAYQQYFRIILDDHNALASFTPPTVTTANSTACAALKTQADGLWESILGRTTQVAQPNACAPHVMGIAADLSFTNISYAAAQDILATNHIGLYWRNLTGDKWHFELVPNAYQSSHGDEYPYLPSECNQPNGSE